MRKLLMLSAVGFLLGSYAFASQEFVAINGIATSIDGSIYKISGEVVDVSAGLNLVDAKRVSFEQIKFVAPPHVAIKISDCPNGIGTFLVGSNGGDVFQPTTKSEISDGWENVAVLYDFTCVANR